MQLDTITSDRLKEFGFGHIALSNPLTQLYLIVHPCQLRFAIEMSRVRIHDLHSVELDMGVVIGDDYRRQESSLAWSDMDDMVCLGWVYSKHSTDDVSLL